MGKPRQTQIIRNPDLQRRRQAFSKRRETLFKKGQELSVLTDSDVSFRVRSSTGITYYKEYQRGKLIYSNIARRKGKVNSSTGPREWEEDLVKQECDACTAKEDLQSVIANHEACLAYARERLENWENNPSVKAGDSGVKVDCETEERTDEGIDSILKRFDHDDCESFWTSVANLTAGGASDPTSSGLDDCEFNMNDLLRPENLAIGGPDAYLDLSEDNIGDAKQPENSIVGGGFNHPDDFPELEDLDVDIDLSNF